MLSKETILANKELVHEILFDFLKFSYKRQFPEEFEEWTDEDKREVEDEWTAYIENVKQTLSCEA